MSPIAIVDSTSQTHTVLVSLNDFDLIDVDFSWSFSWTLKKGPRIDRPPWVTRVRELKHLGVHVLQLKHGDPFPQARADRSAARSRPDRRAGAHNGWCLKWNAHCARQQFYWPCDVGLIHIKPKALVTVESHLSEMCKLHIEETASCNTGKVNNINLTHIKSYTQSVDTFFS